MIFTFLSLLNMTISGSILIMIIYLLVRHNKMLVRFGTKLLSVGVFLIIIRFFFPFEFSFTHIIGVDKIFPDIYGLLIKDFPLTEDIIISIRSIFFYVWGIVAAIMLINSFFAYRRLRKLITRYTPVEDAAIQALVNQISATHKNSREFHLVETDQITTPMIFGIRNPYIILPVISLEQAEWTFVLSHEISHFYQGHLYYKLFCEILCDLYWWNPFVYLLRKLLNNLLEMAVDAEVTKSLKAEDKLDYLKCLLKISKMSIYSFKRVQWAVTFSNQDTTLISKRIHILLDSMEVKKSKFFLLICGIVISYFLFGSYFFIVQPENRAAICDTTFSFNDSGCFLISNHDGSYDIYVDSQYVSTIPTSLPDVPNVKIYSSLKEAINDEKN